jgi:hypothetical protein
LPELEFALASGQNNFFAELAEVLVHEIGKLGGRARISTGDPPVPREGVVHVFLPPHEYVTLAGYELPEGVLRRSILISAEQPKSSFFGRNVQMASDAGAVFDINPRAVRAYRSRGREAALLELGYTSLWDTYEAGTSRRTLSGRDIDILFLGRHTDRRARALSSYADIFERFHCHIVLSDNSRPNTANAAGFAAGETKRSLMARSKVLLNIHGEEEPYFEWLRLAEGICAGCAIVSEHSTDHAPLEYGRHLAMGALGSLGALCAWLVDDSERRERMRNDAYALLAERRPMSAAARQLITAAERLDGERPETYAALAVRQRHVRAELARPSEGERNQPIERSNVSDGEALALRALKREQLAVMGLRRELRRLEWRIETGAYPKSHAVQLASSPAWRDGRPAELTVVTPVYNHRRFVLDALDSLLRSTYLDWEAVVVDDASTDGGADAVRDWIARHPDRACLLVGHEVNRGLAAARNSGTARARSARLLMLDADNEVRRNTMSRLMGALDAAPGASFAYGIIERFSAEGSQNLMNTLGWEPERLRSSNYIDAFTLIRREALEAINGYSSSPHLYGWEDYDLWVRMAESGRWGAFVSEIVARYRVGYSSMISETNVSTADAYAAIADHAPGLMDGVVLPR